MLRELDKDFKPRGDFKWFVNFSRVKFFREWQSYSHFVTKSLILVKTIKKREKQIIASETELMNCRREKQRVYLISQRRQRINAMAPKTWTEIVKKTDEK